MLDIKKQILQNRNGVAVGLPCFCTANELVLRAVFQYVKDHKVPAVIEATCNQVNQDGGYTGMVASDFRNWMESLVAEYGVSSEDIILGGDHLGPNPWRHLSAKDAMEKAEILVKDYAAAGFRKLHLDASMACGDEPVPSFELVAQRAARLCKIAEEHSPCPDDLVYIVGTEVPIPGGETDDMEELTVTSVERLNQTINTHREAFESEGLSHVWPKIVSVVTQPGVDFSHTAVHPFAPDKATELSEGIKNFDNLSFEAHSTDYQPTKALADLVNKHFFFLKVGPELTFRMREAVFSLAYIEDRILPERDRSNVIQTIDLAMNENSEHWAPYYRGDKDKIEQLKHFSYSDRIRYYWTTIEVRTALDKLFRNLSNNKIPEAIVSQYFHDREFGSLNVPAEQLVSEHTASCIDRYYKACGYG